MNTRTLNFRGKSYLLVLATIAVIALSSLTLLSRTRTLPSGITVANNSGREVRAVYFSPPDSDNWGPDQLHGSSITTGNSATLGYGSCYDGSVKIVAEDQDGCFLYHTVSCAADQTWTIANDTARDCGN